MKNKLTKTIAVIFSFLLLIVPVFIFAATTGAIQNPLRGGTDISSFIQSILRYVVRIGGVIAIFAFIWSGYSFVRAQGNPAELQKAKTIFINTCIGVAVLLGAQLIASIIVGSLQSLR